MKSYEVSARTIEEAISNGLEQLGVSISDVTVDILEEGSKGLFGLFGSRPAKVRLTLKEDDEEESVKETKEIFENTLSEQPAPEKAKPAPQPKPAAPKAERKPAEDAAPNPDKAKTPAPRPRKPREKKENRQPDAQPAKEAAPAREIVPAEQADRATPAGRAQEFLQQLTELMGVKVSVAVATDDEGNVRVNMDGDTLGILIGRRGETLDALQYLTSLQVNKGRNEYTRVTLDTEGYRAKREEALVRLANRMANRCQKTGRKVALEPMNPYERRILHSALQNHPAVTTHSEGEEPNRHVVITLKPQA